MRARDRCYDVTFRVDGRKEVTIRAGANTRSSAERTARRRLHRDHGIGLGAHVVRLSICHVPRKKR